MTTHQGSIHLVNDANGYAIGRASACSCGWTSGDLRDTPGQALLDYFAHLKATTKGTTA
jgi:hypothetical protein